MRIAVDGRYMCDAYPGIGRYLFNLLEALPGVLPAANVSVLVDPSSLNSRHDLERLRCAGLRLVQAPLRPRSLRERLQLARVLTGLGPDVVHSPYYFGPRAAQPEVLSLHDVIPLEARVPRAWPARLVARRALRLRARRATRVLVPSAAVRDDVLRLLRLPPERLALAPYGVSSQFAPQDAAAQDAMRRRLELPERYVLHVGTHAPHKNVDGLLRAWARCDRRDHVLALAGGSGRDGAHVRRLGDVPEEHLPALYSSAALVVVPSLREGFGLPVLEAMACGAPVACARAASLPEVAGDAAATFDPTDTAALAELVGALLADDARRQELRARGLARAAGYSWSRTARLTAAAYGDAAAQAH